MAGFAVVVAALARSLAAAALIFTSYAAQADVLYSFTQTSVSHSQLTLSMVIDIPTYPNFLLVDSNLDYHSPINLNGFSMNISPGLQVATPDGMVDFAPRGLNQFPQWSVSINEMAGLLSGIISYMNSDNSEQFLLNVANDVASIHFSQDGGLPCDNNLSAVGCTFNGYFTSVVVPEPSTLPLLTTTLIALPFFLWRRSHRRSYS